MRVLPLAIAAILLGGCADTPAPEPPVVMGPVLLPTAREAVLADNDLLLALPVGPSTSAFLVDVPESAWKQLSLLGTGAPEPYWDLRMAVRFEEPFVEEAGEQDEADPATSQGGPRAAALTFRVGADGALVPSQSIQFLEPQPIAEADFSMYDLSPCAPGDRQYLVVVMTEGDASGLNVTLSVPGGARLGEAVRVRPDATGGAPLLATYIHSNGRGEEPTGWALTDSRTVIPVLDRSDVGSLRLDLASAGSAGLYALSVELVTSGEVGRLQFDHAEDGAAGSSVYPLAEYAAQHFLTATGDFGADLALALDLTAARAGVFTDRRIAYAAPLDLAPLGLSVATQETWENIYTILYDFFGAPATCGIVPA